ncbi:MAG TPA: glutamate-1-semialdehyde 2,1-aminomutase [Verrucomicrobiae bacterium]|jgi:glutamate-1-semialdehyde 2,1-aminomutase|nr:glutamate-1-semialdehyde 2,1-aminomutase [Verrucomicrobiae bacterium]
MATEPAIRPTPTLKRDRQVELYHRALKTMPGGTDSNFRSWGEDTVYVDRGKGGRVWDLDDNEFVDLRMGYGPVILGHADPRVDDYVNERMRRGVSFSLTSEDEVRACELIAEITGWVEMARMTVSGTEATMHLMRIARGYTGRTKIVKFEGQYHGVHDYALISVLPNDMDELGDRDNPVRLAWGRGIPEAVTQTVIPVPYNDLETLRRVFEAEGDDIAAVIIEPVLGNAQGILPKEGFHQGVRAITQEFGALLIFDEVKTGFRMARGGAAEYFGIKPDLASFAKAIGNGYPAAAFGGSREVMSMLPDKVSHGGTYAGNRVAAAAAVATLSILKDGSVVEALKRRGESIQAGLASILNAKGLPYNFTGVPAMFGIMFTDQDVREYRDWVKTDHDLYDAVAVGMHPRGAMPEPDSREPWFLCAAHTDADEAQVLEAFEGSLEAALDARAQGIAAPGLVLE